MTHRFEKGSEAVVSLTDADADGAFDLSGSDAGFFVIEDGRFSPSLAEARARTSIESSPIVEAASRSTVAEFWGRVQDASAG